MASDRLGPRWDNLSLGREITPGVTDLVGALKQSLRDIELAQLAEAQCIKEVVASDKPGGRRSMSAIWDQINADRKKNY